MAFNRDADRDRKRQLLDLSIEQARANLENLRAVQNGTVAPAFHEVDPQDDVVKDTIDEDTASSCSESSEDTGIPVVVEGTHQHAPEVIERVYYRLPDGTLQDEEQFRQTMQQLTKRATSSPEPAPSPERRVPVPTQQPSQGLHVDTVVASVPVQSSPRFFHSPTGKQLQYPSDRFAPDVMYANTKPDSQEDRRPETARVKLTNMARGRAPGSPPIPQRRSTSVDRVRNQSRKNSRTAPATPANVLSRGSTPRPLVERGRSKSADRKPPVRRATSVPRSTSSREDPEEEGVQDVPHPGNTPMIGLKLYEQAIRAKEAKNQLQELARKRMQEMEEDQLKSCTFRPNITSSALSRPSEGKSVFNRLGEVDPSKRKKDHQEMEDKAKKLQMKECTFKPKVDPKAAKTAKEDAEKAYERLFADANKRKPTPHPPSPTSKALSKKEQVELTQRLYLQAQERKKKEEALRQQALTSPKKKGNKEAVLSLYQDAPRKKIMEELQKRANEEFAREYTFHPKTTEAKKHRSLSVTAASERLYNDAAMRHAKRVGIVPANERSQQHADPQRSPTPMENHYDD
eukprot:TRINITY_DN3519_c0_g1_i1.p1 TRINITY_DN3519_c0_g1~~TRINITY_DN3519_c0_g1_i1.p1  ORF type:complete len:572 (+),score=101.35 TRINITY_DN3519_c0_g1_i1:106-1821(+)